MNPKTNRSITNKRLLSISFLDLTSKPRQWVFVGSHFVYSYVLPTLFSFVFSFLVVQKGSLALWGEYVLVFSIVSIGSLVAQWGGKEWLTRAFSENPSQRSTLWISVVWPRMFLALLGSPLVLFFLPWPIALVAMGWMVTSVFLRFTEVVFTYQKSFKALLFSEGIYGAILIFVLTLLDNPTLSTLCWGTWIAIALKLAVLWISPVCRNFLHSFQWTNYSMGSFSQGVFFFLLALLGMAENRMDIFCIEYFYSPTEVGRFSIVLQMLFLLKNIPAFFVEPLTKNLYRSSLKVKSNVSQVLLGMGLVISTLGVAAVGVVCFFGFGLLFSWKFYFLAMAYVLPRYIFSMDLFLMFQHKKDQSIVLGLAFATLAHLGCNVLFLPLLGVEMSILSAAIAQWLLYFYFSFFKPKII